MINFTLLLSESKEMLTLFITRSFYLRIKIILHTIFFLKGLNTLYIYTSYMDFFNQNSCKSVVQLSSIFVQKYNENPIEIDIKHTVKLTNSCVRN